MKEKVKNLILYGGISREDYQKVQPIINDRNRKMIIALSGFATILIAFMLVSSMRIDGVSMNKVVYAAGAVISPLIFLVALFYAKKHQKAVSLLVPIVCAFYYVYGILIGAVLDPAEKTVTLMVLFVLLPVVFIDHPIRVFGVTFSFMLIFVGLCFQNKTGGILENDLLDAIVFSMLGIAAGTVLNRRLILGFLDLLEKEDLLGEKEKLLEDLNQTLCEKEKLIKEHEALVEELKKVSKEDKLTGMKNRNAYELELYEVPRIMKDSLACVYIDVNGLKRINDDFGHKRGDEMLIYVAEKIKEHFGDKLAYRIGGDEFIVFIPDPEKLEISTKVDELSTEIEERGYYASCGWEFYDKEKGRLSLTVLIKSAEERMYDKKTAFYYEHPELDRRSS